jgi:phage gp46-like protein
MIQDFSVIQDNLGYFDIEIDTSTKDFKSVSGFETAIDFQLFIDKRASKDEVTLARNRQGWLGDLMTKQNNYEVGGFIYLKNQSRNTINDKNEIVAYAKDGLEYFIQIGAAKNIEAFINGDNIEGKIIIDNNNINRFSRTWNNTLNKGV